MKIGFFDSGLGGLLIMKAVAAALPQFDYEYYGDTKHLPYGEKTEAEIFELTKAGMEHLFARGSVLNIIACNTASAETLRRLQDTWLPQAHPDKKILGVIIPMVEALTTSRIQKALLIGTTRTIASQKYERELAKCHSDVELCSVATPTLVPLLEAGKRAEALAAAIDVIDTYRKEGIEGVVLGCTHYGLLIHELRAHYQDRLRFFSQHEIIPAKLAQYLDRHVEITEQLTKEGTRNIYLTEHRADYDATLATILHGSFLAEE